MKLKTEWKCTSQNPDEEYLQTLIESEKKDLELSFASEKEDSKRKEASLSPLLKASGIRKQDINKLLKDDAAKAKKFIETATKQIAKQPYNFDRLYEQEAQLKLNNVDQLAAVHPIRRWRGCVWHPRYGGAWYSYNGEREERPNVSFNLGASRFDPRAQAFGEGWFDGDYSLIHGYLAFQFRPPSWGHLHIYTNSWLHGYYCLYSDDKWYNSAYARADVHTWVDVHQNYWRPRQYNRRFSLRGGEIHPRRCGRIDRQYGHTYTTFVGAGDVVTVRVGVRLYCYARASGSSSILNFQAGAGNYVYVPNICWFLHR